MAQVNALQIILVISVAGILFSGYLSYHELFAKKCKFGCSTKHIVGLPPCVYGLVMYAIVFLVALLGLQA